MIKAVNDSEAALACDPSHALQRARSGLRDLVNFFDHGGGAAEPKLSFMVPGTTDAANRWRALFSYRETPISDLKIVIHWCQNYANDLSIPRTTSLLAEALLTSKTGIAFAAKAENFVQVIMILEDFEAALILWKRAIIPCGPSPCWTLMPATMITSWHSTSRSTLFHLKIL